MTQLDALRELAEKVEAGTLSTKGVVYANAITTSFNDLKMHGYATAAYNGSLDAAHSLHKAVLGDRWHVEDLSQAARLACAPWGCILRCCGGSSPDIDVSSRYDFDNNPARAWILAIIKAKIAEMEGKNDA